MRFISYFIIGIIVFLIGISSRNSLDLISRKEILSLRDYFPNIHTPILEPVVDIIIKDFTSMS